MKENREKYSANRYQGDENFFVPTVAALVFFPVSDQNPENIIPTVQYPDKLYPNKFRWD